MEIIFHMTFKITCSNCKEQLYSGFDLKSARDILKLTAGKCKQCNTNLSSYDFMLEVESKAS